MISTKWYSMILAIAPTVLPLDWEWQIRGNYVACEMDLSGKVYAIDNAYNFMIFDQSRDTVKRISVANYGAEPMIDASNPLEIFVFFANTGKVLWFDNQLNQQSSIDIFKAEITRAAAFGRANDGSIWVLDNNTRTLKKLNKEGVKTQESIWISGFQSGNSVKKILDNGETVLVPDGANNVYVFDQNLVLLRTKKNSGQPLGIKDKYCYFSRDRLILGESMEKEISLKQDTLFVAPDSLNICAANAERVLLQNSGGVFLHRRK